MAHPGTLSRLRAAAQRRVTPGRQTLLTSVAVGLLGAVTGVLVARLLGPASRGDLAAIVSWSGFTLGIATLGIDDALTYHGGTFLRKAQLDARTLKRWVVYLGLGAGVLVALVVLALPITVDHRTSIVITIGAAGAVLVMQSCLIGLLLGLGGYSAFNRARLIGPTVYALGVTALFLADEDSLALVVVLVCLSWIAPMVSTYANTRRLLENLSHNDGYLDTDRTGDEWRTLLRYGLRAQVAKLSTQASMRLDQALLVFFVSPSTLGLYAVAATVGTITPNLLYQAHARITFGRFRQLAEVRPLERSDAWRSVRRFLVLVLAVQGAIAVAAPAAVPLVFGESFRDAGPIASALALATVPFAISRMLQSWLMAAGRIESVSRVEVVAVVGQVALIVVLCSGPLGVWGAVIASAASYSVSMGLQAGLLRHASRRERTEPL